MNNPQVQNIIGASISNESLWSTDAYKVEIVIQNHIVGIRRQMEYVKVPIYCSPDIAEIFQTLAIYRVNGNWLNAVMIRGTK